MINVRSIAVGRSDSEVAVLRPIMSKLFWSARVGDAVIRISERSTTTTRGVLGCKSHEAFARRIGMTGPNDRKKCRRREMPDGHPNASRPEPYIALAITALAAGLEPWTP